MTASRSWSPLIRVGAIALVGAILGDSLFESLAVTFCLASAFVSTDEMAAERSAS